MYYRIQTPTIKEKEQNWSPEWVCMVAKLEKFSKIEAGLSRPKGAVFTVRTQWNRKTKKKIKNLKIWLYDFFYTFISPIRLSMSLAILECLGADMLGPLHRISVFSVFSYRKSETIQALS